MQKKPRQKIKKGYVVSLANKVTLIFALFILSCTADPPSNVVLTTQPANTLHINAPQPYLDTLLRSTVMISTSVDTTAWTGSGFIFAQNECEIFILTAHHVLRSYIETKPRLAKNITLIHEPWQDGLHFLFDARIVAIDETLDLAVVATRKPLITMPSLVLQENDLPGVGSEVLVCGTPGLAYNFVSNGVVARHIEIGGVNIIQTTAFCDHGSSGSPIVDIKTGHVIGMVQKTTASGKMGLGITSYDIMKWLKNNQDTREKMLPVMSK